MSNIVELRDKCHRCLSGSANVVFDLETRVSALEGDSSSTISRLLFPALAASKSIVHIRDALTSGYRTIHLALMDLIDRVQALQSGQWTLNVEDCSTSTSKIANIVQLRDVCAACCAKIHAALSELEEKLDSEPVTFTTFDDALQAFVVSAANLEYMVTMLSIENVSSLTDGAELVQWGSKAHTEDIAGEPMKMLFYSSGGYNDKSYLHLPRYTVLDLDADPLSFTDGFSFVFTMRSVVYPQATPLNDSANALLRFELPDETVLWHYARPNTRTLTFQLPIIGSAPGPFLGTQYVNTQMKMGDWGAYGVVVSIDETNVYMSTFKNGQKIMSLTQYGGASAWSLQQRTLSKIMINGDPNSAYGGVNNSPSDMYSGTDTDISALAIFNGVISDQDALQLTGSVISVPDIPGAYDNDWSVPAISPSVDLRASQVATDGPVASWGVLQQSDPALQPTKSGGVVAFTGNNVLVSPQALTMANSGNSVTFAARFRRTSTSPVNNIETFMSMVFTRSRSNTQYNYRLSMEPNGTPGAVNFTFDIQSEPWCRFGIAFVNPSSTVWHEAVVRMDGIMGEIRLWFDGTEYVVPFIPASNPWSFLYTLEPDVDMNDSIMTIGHDAYEFTHFKAYPGGIPTSTVSTLFLD